MKHAKAPKISVIIPCYNALGKIERCLHSLERIDVQPAIFEVIFVDDCSTDGTFDTLTEAVARHPNWRAIQLEANSGSPSRPRNRGHDVALGEYVFFLDCDDEILPDTLGAQLEHAERTGADIVRGYLLADDGKVRRPMNRIGEWKPHLSADDKLRLILQKQSTTPPGLIRASLLRTNGITWMEDIRMGEDTIFLVDVLSAATAIEYIDHPTYVYNKAPSWTPSSTQQYGERELLNHLRVWSEAERKLAPKSISYYQTRLQVGLGCALQSLIWHNPGDIPDEAYRKLSAFVQGSWHTIQDFNYNPRHREIVAALNAGDIAEIRRLLRPKLVISGYDLKFAKPLIPFLEERFEVKVDEWTGHAKHDEQQSESLLAWAEVIWCEWLLENAVWWSHRKRKDQVLLVRMHRFELSRDFGIRANAEAVDCFFCVSVYYFEKLIESFGYDRRKVRLLPNILDLRRFSTEHHQDRSKNLAMVGFSVSRKGFHRALELLVQLRESDETYQLHCFGNKPDEVPWIAKISKERKYFDDCNHFISEHGIKDAVRFHGHVDVPESLAKNNIGFVLSTSTSESFHFAPAEGFAAGGQGVLLDWDGVEFIYPDRYIFSSVGELRDYILSQQSSDAFEQSALEGRSFVEERYSADRILKLITSAVEEFSP